MGLRNQDNLAKVCGYAPGRVCRLLEGVAAMYAGGIVAWYLLDRTGMVDWWLFQFADVFSLWFYLPLPLLVLSGLLLRDWRSVVWLALPMLLFAGDYGSLFVPHAGASEGTHLRAMTANLEFTNGNAGSLEDLLREERPDIVALQELGTTISGLLPDRVRDIYPYQSLRPRSDWLGMGILSRYPIRDSTRSEVASDCGCQQLTIEVEGRLVTVLNVHPGPPIINSVRWGPLVLPTGFSTSEQVETILGAEARAMAVAGPLLILGDLNATDREELYWILGRRFRDAYREAGWGFGFTFPARRQGFARIYPPVRIDYVFHDDSWIADSARVVDLPGSDHHGVIAQLTLLEPR